MIPGVAVPSAEEMLNFWRNLRQVEEAGIKVVETAAYQA